MVTTLLKPTRVKLALLLPGIAFVILELLLEPRATLAAAPGLFILAAAYYLLVSLAEALRRRDRRAPRFRTLLGGSLFLLALDQLAKLLVLRRLPLGHTLPLIPGALKLAHAHNLRGSWAADQFGLDFLGAPLLIAIALLFTILTLSLYRYYEKENGRPSMWAGIALIGFVAGTSSAFVDLAFRGYTVDFLGVAGLVVADFKDLYLDAAIAVLAAELVENDDAARRMSNRETLTHVKRALQLSGREVGELLR